MISYSLAKMFLGMTQTDLQWLAYDEAERNEIDNNFNKNERQELAG
jgi:hypothetical protein